MRIRRGPDPGPFTDYGAYKPSLQLVFRSRCAYCLTPDSRLGGLDGMTVDHFRPLKRYGHLITAWGNLYYACFVCNCHYKKDRPTEEEEGRGCRFVDPCAEDPDDHFRLVGDPDTGDLCRVRPLTCAAEYTAQVLAFDRRKSLRDFWREIERLLREGEEQISKTREALVLVRAQLRQKGDSPGLRGIRDNLTALLTRLRRRLAEILSMRPFPAE